MALCTHQRKTECIQLALRLRPPLLSIRRPGDLAAGRFDQPARAHQMHVRYRDHAPLRHRVANLLHEEARNLIPLQRGFLLRRLRVSATIVYHRGCDRERGPRRAHFDDACF